MSVNRRRREPNGFAVASQVLEDAADGRQTLARRRRRRRRRLAHPDRPPQGSASPPGIDPPTPGIDEERARELGVRLGGSRAEVVPPGAVLVLVHPRAPSPSPPHSHSSSQSSSSRRATATCRVRLAHAVNRWRKVMSSVATLDFFIDARTLDAASRSLAAAHACKRALNAHVSSSMPRAFIPAEGVARRGDVAHLGVRGEQRHERVKGRTPDSSMSRIISSTRMTAS